MLKRFWSWLAGLWVVRIGCTLFGYGRMGASYVATRTVRGAKRIICTIIGWLWAGAYLAFMGAIGILATLWDWLCRLWEYIRALSRNLFGR